MAGSTCAGASSVYRPGANGKERCPQMTAQFPLPEVDPGGLEEFSVVFTDRSVNHMSAAFQQVMRDISATLKQAYNAAEIAVVPGWRHLRDGGGGAPVRQGGPRVSWCGMAGFPTAGHRSSTAAGLPARRPCSRPARPATTADRPFAPAPIEEVTAAIREVRPDVVFAPHVETSAGDDPAGRLRGRHGCGRARGRGAVGA